MPTILAAVLYFAAFACFAFAAFGRGRFDTRVSLVPLGLAFWVAVPLGNALVALD